MYEGAKFMKHQVLYIKKNLILSTFTTSKDIKIRQPGPELRGVSKYPRTFGHPVDLEFLKNWLRSQNTGLDLV